MATQHVCFLMCTCNGAEHLAAQLQSMVEQTHDDWSLRVSDDGSTDGTRAILENFRARHPERDIRWYEGPRQGYGANFLSLLGRPDLPADSWVALSDQDDVWMPDRIARALDRMAAAPGQPRFYASRTIITGPDLRPRHPSRLHARTPGFGNALVQNIFAGNTIVLDPAAAALVNRTVPHTMAGQGVPHHDWWLYQLMSGVGAELILDPRPGLYYRQHDGNLLGAHRGLRPAMSRLAMVWDRRYSNWISCNVAALQRLREDLTGENRDLLDHFAAWRAAGHPGGRRRGGVWRQSLVGNLFLEFAARTGRI